MFFKYEINLPSNRVYQRVIYTHHHNYQSKRRHENYQVLWNSKFVNQGIKNVSYLNLSPWNCNPQLKPSTTITGSGSFPASSKFINRRGHLGGALNKVGKKLLHINHNHRKKYIYINYRSTRDEKGCTTSDVPRIISRSQRGKSSSTNRKRGGSASPKKTASGFTTELHKVQRGTISERIFSV